MISLVAYLGSLVGITLLAILIACVGSMVTMVLFDLFVTSPDDAKNVYTEQNKRQL